MKGLEPTRLAASDPKSDASTNFATPAIERYFERQNYEQFLKYPNCFVYFFYLCVVVDVVGGDFWVVGEYDESLNDVAELSYVAGP